MRKIIPNTYPHSIPKDMRAVVSSKPVSEFWKKITPLARNEWICWVTSVKKKETRTKHLLRLSEDLQKGKKRPCCWSGCPHRK